MALEGFTYARTDPEGRPVPILGPLDFEVQPGECVAVGGPSGSGKSTFLGVLAGLWPGWGGTATGRALWDGRPVAALSARDKAAQIGVFQQDTPGQFLHRTVREDCSFTPENLGWPRVRIDRTVDLALRRFGIAHLAERSPRTLSGGEQALVLLASLCLLRPRLLLLDEPLANLDPDHCRQVTGALAQLKNEGCTLVICEHRLEVLGTLVDRRFFLDKGVWMAGGLEPIEAPEPDPGPVAAPAIGPPRITARDLSVARGGRTLVSHLDFSLASGEILVLRGPNGVGKSSLLRLLAGLDKPASGSLEVDGTVRLVGQDPLDQLCRASVREECALDLRARDRRTKRGPLPGQPETVLGQVGLEGTLDQSPFTLSEGEKRRLTAACGALAGADILALDEPSAGLDPRSTGALAALVRRAAASGSAVVCATHDEAFARILGGRDLNLAPWSRSLADTPVPRREPEVQPGPPGLDPRFGFCLFLATLGLAAFPWPLEVAAALLGALVLSYPVAGRLRELGAFARPLAVFWVTPGLVLWALAGPEAALAGSVRLGLLSLLFHRYSLLVEGKELSASLAKWGLPYSAGFALTAALNLVPTLGTRLGRIHEILVLRLTPGRGRRSFPSVRVVAAMLVPTVVHLWQMAVRLAMNLELRGFEGLSPDQALAKTKKSD